MRLALSYAINKTQLMFYWKKKYRLQRTRDILGLAVKEAWNSVPSEYLAKLSETVPARRKAVSYRC